MNEQEIDKWIETELPVYDNLTKTFVSICENLLRSANIDYLSVSGRTKTSASIKEKIKRKSYQHPPKQVTDISGVRIILYFESDVERVCRIIENSFDVDKKNSLNKEALLSTDQVGYRSVHLVCELGHVRTSLPEFSAFKNKKCEFQVRTVLQHAWAELAHDRNYKFSGKLPREIERKLYLYAGMLEIADRGFDELSKQIDKYIENIKSETEQGNLSIEINSLSLEEFVREWSKSTGFPLQEPPDKDKYIELVDELHEFGIDTLERLRSIIPSKYIEAAKKLGYSTNIYGLIRDWMLMTDYQKYRDYCWHEKWFGIGAGYYDTGRELSFYREVVGDKLTKEIFDTFPPEPVYDPNF